MSNKLRLSLFFSVSQIADCRFGFGSFPIWNLAGPSIALLLSTQNKSQHTHVKWKTTWDQLSRTSFSKYRVFFFTGPPLKKTKSKIMLEYPDWASPGPPQTVKVHGQVLPSLNCQTGPPLKSSLWATQGYYHHLNWILGEAQSGYSNMILDLVFFRGGLVKKNTRSETLLPPPSMFIAFQHHR